MPKAQLVRVERRPPIALVTIDRPAARNALSRALVAELAAAATSLAEDAEVHFVVLRGEGDKVFCAGADLKERQGFSLEETRAFVAHLNEAFDRWATLPQLTLCQLNGSAYGGGLELALTCDLRVATEGSELGLTEVRWGIIPGAGGTQRLPRVVGTARAKELILLGQPISAERALAIGLVNAIRPKGALGDLGDLLPSGVAPLSIRAAKRAIDEGFGLPLADGLRLERACYETILTSDDRNEGLRAFAEKRPPRYAGR